MLTKIEIQDKIDNLNKPKGSLGFLETLALQICEIQQTLTPQLNHPCHLLFGADHGIEKEGVSVSPRCITWQQMINFTRGGGGVNMFCRQHGFKLRIVDVGVDYDLTAYPEIINRKVGKNGTNNFLHEAAMSTEEWNECLNIGSEMVNECHNEGCNVLSIGEMGIGNTSPSSVLMHLLLDIPLEKCVGAGAGLSSSGTKRKLAILQQAVDTFKANVHRQAQTNNMDTYETNRYIMQYFCGYEMAATIGAMLRAAELHMIIIVDGFIMTACILAASRLQQEVMKYAIFGHCGDESGHKLMLEEMGATPILSLGLRLGEGTGAMCAYPIIQSAVNMICEMNNFDNAKITKYF